VAGKPHFDDGEHMPVLPLSIFNSVIFLVKMRDIPISIHGPRCTVRRIRDKFSDRDRQVPKLIETARPVP